MQNAESVRSAFRQLHQSGCFVIPNPWDIGSAKYLRHLGFKALATTSAGFAFSRGLPDSSQAVGIDAMLQHIAEIVSATALPVNADFGSAFADEPEGVARNVKRCVQTGVAGLSVEDATGRDKDPLYEFQLAIDRVRAARAAINETQTGVLLTARAECYLTGHPKPFEEAMHRLQAFSDAGADVLYAPGVTEPEEIKELISAVAPKPVNVLMGSDTGLRLSDLAALGARRISVGSSLARTAWAGFIKAAKQIADQGSFEGFRDLVPFNELNTFFQGGSQK
jgi:2-methylisocitrate lyase-like PEP mutase family enzyme